MTAENDHEHQEEPSYDFAVHSLGDDVDELSDGEFFGRCVLGMAHAFSEAPDPAAAEAAFRRGDISIRFTARGMTVEPA